MITFIDRGLRTMNVLMKYDAVYDYVKITVLRYISIVKKT